MWSPQQLPTFNSYMDIILSYVGSFSTFRGRTPTFPAYKFQRKIFLTIFRISRISFIFFALFQKAVFYDDTSEKNCNTYSTTRSGFGYLAGFTLLVLVFYIIVVVCLIAKTHSRPFHTAILTIFIGGDFVMMTLMASRSRF